MVNTWTEVEFESTSTRFLALLLAFTARAVPFSLPSKPECASVPRLQPSGPFLPSTLAQHLTKQTGSLQSMNQTEFFGQYPSSQAFRSPQCRDSFTHGFKLGYVHSSKLKLVLHIPVICKYFLTPGMSSRSLLLGRFHHSARWSSFTVRYYSQKNTHMNRTIYRIIACK